jgi:HEAT repeat protein
MFQRIELNRRTLLTALVAGVLALMVSTGRAADDDAAASTSGTKTQSDVHVDSADVRLQSLIKQLGSPQFTIRRAAANEIRKIGPEAFDQLHAATEDSDPEIAASANYLMRQIAVRWIRSDDSATVKRLMRGYSDRDDGDRQRIIQMLAGLPEGEGVAGLCRVARFDRTPWAADPRSTWARSASPIRAR